MNETRQLILGLKMSPTPGENKRLPHEVGVKGAMSLASDLVMSSSPAPALFPSLPTLHTGQPLPDHVAMLCN